MFAQIYLDNLRWNRTKNSYISTNEMTININIKVTSRSQNGHRYQSWSTMTLERYHFSLLNLETNTYRNDLVISNLNQVSTETRSSTGNLSLKLWLWAWMARDQEIVARTMTGLPHVSVLFVTGGTVSPHNTHEHILRHRCLRLSSLLYSGWDCCGDARIKKLTCIVHRGTSAGWTEISTDQTAATISQSEELSLSLCPSALGWLLCLPQAIYPRRRLGSTFNDCLFLSTNRRLDWIWRKTTHW